MARVNGGRCSAIVSVPLDDSVFGDRSEVRVDVEYDFDPGLRSTFDEAGHGASVDIVSCLATEMVIGKECPGLSDGIRVQLKAPFGLPPSPQSVAVGTYVRDHYPDLCEILLARHLLMVEAGQ